MQKLVDLGHLVQSLNQSQMIRWSSSGKTLPEFLDSEDEKLVTESILVLTNLMQMTPHVVITM